MPVRGTSDLCSLAQALCKGYHWLGIKTYSADPLGGYRAHQRRLAGLRAPADLLRLQPRTLMRAMDNDP